MLGLKIWLGPVLWTLSGIKTWLGPVLVSSYGPQALWNEIAKLLDILAKVIMKVSLPDQICSYICTAFCHRWF